MGDIIVPEKFFRASGVGRRAVMPACGSASGLSDADRLPAPDKLRKPAEERARKRLDDLASLVRTLTYGEMIEMAQAIWNAQPEGAAITEENLPALLHHWSKARLC
jgi:hypothetical protein